MRRRHARGLPQWPCYSHSGTAALRRLNHEVDSRDKTIIATPVDKLRVQGGLLEDDVARLPFNTMREW